MDQRPRLDAVVQPAHWRIETQRALRYFCYRDACVLKVRYCVASAVAIKADLADIVLARQLLDALGDKPPVRHVPRSRLNEPAPHPVLVRDVVALCALVKILFGYPKPREDVDAVLDAPSERKRCQIVDGGEVEPTVARMGSEGFR